jgi:hypothetical protein
MKITKAKADVTFKPYKIEITIESRADEIFLRDLYKRNITVPTHIYGDADSFYKQQLITYMTEMCNLLPI